VLSPAEAARLLRDHGDSGGAYAADLLSGPIWAEAVQPDFWFVGLLEDSIYIRGFLNGDEVWNAVTGYDRVPRSVPTPSQLVQDLGPSLWKRSGATRSGGCSSKPCGSRSRPSRARTRGSFTGASW
jgi:hypothetical protein